jgi:predicted GNAT family acetyltransferase
MSEANDIRLETRANRGRYVRTMPDGTEAEMTFVEDRPGVVIILHTYTPPQYRGQGIAATLVARAAADFRAGGRKVVPACWFARQELEAHPEWADLLEDGRGGRR